MHTYLLGDQEVDRYVRDLVQRLQRFEHLPTVWCPVTPSGDALLKVIHQVMRTICPELCESTQLLPIEVDSEAQTIRFLDDAPATTIKGKSVLLLDGAIHTGRMMRHCSEEILRHDPAELGSYALVVKRGSVFIPTLWGLMIDETDRACFLLDAIPNNRLRVGERRRQPSRTISIRTA